MKLLLISIAVAVTACAAPVQSPGSLPAPAATPPGTAPAVVVAADRVILSGERAFAVAELTYATAAQGVGVLVDAGLIRRATAVRVRGWNATARAWLVRGKAAGDAAEQARAAAALLAIAADLDAVKGR